MPITEADLLLKPCPLCGRRPELITYDANGHHFPYHAGLYNAPNIIPHYRFICTHLETDFQSYKAYKTHVFDMVYKCQDEWNDGDIFASSSPPLPSSFLSRQEASEISHEEFVEFLGGE